MFSPSRRLWSRVPQFNQNLTVLALFIATMNNKGKIPRSFLGSCKKNNLVSHGKVSLLLMSW